MTAVRGDSGPSLDPYAALRQESAVCSGLRSPSPPVPTHRAGAPHSGAQDPAGELAAGLLAYNRTSFRGGLTWNRKMERLSPLRRR